VAGIRRLCKLFAGLVVAVIRNICAMLHGASYLDPRNHGAKNSCSSASEVCLFGSNVSILRDKRTAVSGTVSLR
jgi:hypothetical protein